jgi:hypothetical protein
MALDFTYTKYKEIVEAISKSDYKVITIGEYIQSSKLPDKFIILRHDVDLDSFYQIKFAELENNLGIHTSYYFRYIEQIYNENIIDKVKDLGHEVGYHYEVFTKAKGNPQIALKLFREELKNYSDNWNSKTVCPHGGSFVDNADGYSLKNIIKLVPKILMGKSVFSKHINFDLWDENSFDDFGIIGDAYRSVDFSEILYLSDTGRSWDNKYKRLDKVESKINPNFKIKSSNDIIKVINNHEADKIYLLVHFEQWKDSFKDWVFWYIAQIIRRTGKKIIFRNK